MVAIMIQTMMNSIVIGQEIVQVESKEYDISVVECQPCCGFNNNDNTVWTSLEDHYEIRIGRAPHLYNRPHMKEAFSEPSRMKWINQYIQRRRHA